MKNSLFTIFVLLILTSACMETTNNDQEEPIIGKKELQLESNIMTPEILWSFGRVSDVKLSPDQSMLLFGISYYDKEQNKGNRELYTLPVEGGEMKQLTKSSQNEFNGIWRPDGNKIGFISSESGSLQIWEMDPDGGNKKQLSDIEGGTTGFSYSPDMESIIYIKDVSLPEKDLEDLYEGLDKAEGKVINRMMFRHWDHWREGYSHIFITEYDVEGIKDIVEGEDIMASEPWDFPLKPFWGMEQLTWHPDGRKIAYSCKKKDGRAFALSTNTDIYVYDIDSKGTRNLTRGMMGYDLSPIWSPDGEKLAWESMKREGYESDKNRIVVFDFIKNSRTDFSQLYDIDAHGIIWVNDSKSIYFTTDWFGSKEIFRLDLDGKFTQLTEGIHNYTSVIPAGEQLIATRQSMSMPTEIFSVPPEAGKEATQISSVNSDILDQLTMGNVEKRWIETTDGRKMLTWIIYPPGFNPDELYPALLYCQGGPQGMVSQFWSYRWNFQMMAANGYIVVAPNRRGVPGFGQEWKEQISGDYPGQNMKDLFRAIDVMAEEPFISKDNLGAVGASYGGYSVFWMAGNHEGRFKGLIAHDGMFNLESQYLETEEMWFVDWDLGGPYWDKDNEVAQRTYSESPHRYVDKWDTPILIIHGAKDFRIAETQGISAFNAAMLNDVPAQFLYFPDENHWVLSPQNGILWQRTFFKWLDSHVKTRY